MGGGVPRVEGKRPVEGGQRVLEPAEVTQRDPMAVVGDGVAGIEGERLVLGGQRFVEPEPLRVSKVNPLDGVGGGVAGVDGKRLVLGGQRVLGPAEIMRRAPAAGVGIGVAALLDVGGCLLKHADRLGRPARSPVGGGEVVRVVQGVGVVGAQHPLLVGQVLLDTG